VKALSLWQPWASLIAVGAKTIETRGWSTTYRGPLLIHAARKIPRLDEAREAWAAFSIDVYTATRATEAPSRFPPGEQPADPLPLGAVVATCILVDVVPMVHACEEQAIRRLEIEDWALWLCEPVEETEDELEGIEAADQRDVSDQRPYGDYAPGRYAWLLADVRPLPTPVPAKGRQGLWTPDADLIAAVEAAA
jgi:hypothetical protein